ncbi:MAG: PAS domain S-box protein [Anaerolineae bacterium]|nr:PAS domain S-box protein [Anaerolineae bacterium]
MHILMAVKENNDYQVVASALKENSPAGEVTWASRGEEVLQHLQTETFDLVLLDREMYKQILDALQKVEEKHRVTLDSMGDAIHVVDSDLRLILCNTTFKQWNEELGLDSDVLGRTIFEVFPFLPNQVREEYRQVFESGQMLVTTERSVAAGREFFTETRKIPIVENNQVSRIVTVIRDITKQRQVEEALRASQEYAMNIIESSPDIIVTVDTDRRIVEFNRAAQTAFDYRPEEVIGRHIDLLYADPQEGLLIHHETIETGQCTREILNRRKNGEVFPVLLSASVLRDAQGQTVGVMGLARDITEWKQAEKALQKSNSQLHALIEALPDVVYFKDVQGRNLIANRAFTELVGLEKEQIVGRTDEQLFAPDLAEQCRRSDQVAWQKGEPVYVEEQLTSQKDETIIFETIKVPLFDDQKNIMGLIGVSRDITAYKRSAAALQRHSFEQEIIGRMARSLNTLNVNEAFPLLVEGLKELTGCDRVSLALIDEAGEKFIMSILESPFPTLEEGTVMPGSTTAAAADILAGQPHLTRDLSTETEFLAEQLLYRAGFRSRVNVPLLAGDEVLGALNLASAQPDFFHQEQLPGLQQIANVLASAVQNSRLFEVEQHQRQAAETLREAALVLTTALNLDEVIERILAQLQQVVAYDTCSVQLFKAVPKNQQREGRLEIVGGRGFPNLPEIVGLSFIIGGDNPNTEVIRTQATIICRISKLMKKHVKVNGILCQSS